MAAGAFFSDQGGGSSYICLPDTPEFDLPVTPGAQARRSSVYGAEYEMLDNPPALGNLQDHNVPCAACYAVDRGSKIMIPGKVNCPPTWTREYYGYLMSESPSHHRTSYECIDVNADAVQNSGSDDDGAVFYFAEVICHNIRCPPYQNGNELPCVVCTK